MTARGTKETKGGEHKKGRVRVPCYIKPLKPRICNYSHKTIQYTTALLYVQIRAVSVPNRDRCGLLAYLLKSLIGIVNLCRVPGVVWGVVPVVGALLVFSWGNSLTN